MKLTRRLFLLSLACVLIALPAACGGNDPQGDVVKRCAQTTCAEGGTCDDSTGELLCRCSRGYDGNRCQFCAPGYADDGQGNCLRNCEAGLQDSDGDGECRPDCTTAGLVCGGAHQVCSDASGEAMCTCDKGFVRRAGACVSMDWTLMVFLNGDNNLDEFAAEDLKEMLHMTADDAVNLIVLFDGSGARDTVLYRIENGARIVLDHADARIFSGNEADMGDWKVLKRFGEWAVKNYPARQYGLFLWNHGGGWRDGGASRCRSPFKEFSSDDTSKSFGIEIANGDYGRALQAISNRAGQKIDLVGFDACLMGMYEVAAATADYGRYLVASEETEPGWGWAWNIFLQELSQRPEMGPVDLGKAIVDAYADYDDPDFGQSNDTLSLVDLGAMDALHVKVTAFADALSEALPAHASTIASLRQKAKAYSYEEHIDFIHFSEMVAEKSSLPAALRTSANALIAQLRENILYNRTNNYSYMDWPSPSMVEVDHSNSNGMAVFFPMSFGENYSRSDFISYKSAMWAEKSTWAAFLDKYL